MTIFFNDISFFQERKPYITPALQPPFVKFIILFRIIRYKIIKILYLITIIIKIFNFLNYKIITFNFL